MAAREIPEEVEEDCEVWSTRYRPPSAGVARMTMRQINLNHKVVEDLRRDLKDAKESNEVLTNRVAILEVSAA
eukprot:105432-Hanusia_phi.AAC.1